MDLEFLGRIHELGFRVPYEERTAVKKRRKRKISQE